MSTMPGSFHSRPDSPHPFRLQQPPPPRPKKSKGAISKALTMPTSTENDTSHQEEPPITPNPPLQTRYIDMLLQLDGIPRLHNILAGIFTWLLLAGYLVLPGTFTSIRNSRALSDGAGNTGKVIVKAAQNLPLLWVAGFCCGVASVGMLFLCKIRYSNYIWMINRIILRPGLTNSTIGFITTIINIYTARSGFWSVTAIVTAAVTGSVTIIMIVLLLIFDIWGLGKIKKEHNRLKKEAELKEAIKIKRRLS